MKEIKFNWAIIVSIIAFLVFVFVSILSLNFLWLGDIGKSTLTALAIGLILLVIAIGLKILKTVKRNFQKYAVLEIIVFALYILFSFVFTIYPYSHYFTVLDRKEEIKNKISADVEMTVKMFDAYEAYAKKRISLHEAQLDAVIYGKDLKQAAFFNAGFKDNGVSIVNQKNILMQIFKDDLMPAEYDSTKLYAVDWLKDAETVATNWNPLSLMNIINKIDSEADKWLSQLKGYSKSTDKAVGTAFIYQISFSSVEDDLTQRSSPNAMALLTGILLSAIILFSYFFAYRDPRHPGLFAAVFHKENTDEEPGIKL